jgi:hypothetical protein
MRQTGYEGLSVRSATNHGVYERPPLSKAVLTDEPERRSRISAAGRYKELGSNCC